MQEKPNKAGIENIGKHIRLGALSWKRVGQNKGDYTWFCHRIYDTYWA